MTAGIVKLPDDFPERLRNFREQRYLTQTDLAFRAKISPRSVHELESGRRDRAQVQTLMLLAKALEVTYADLLNGRASAPVSGDPAESNRGQSQVADSATAAPATPPTPESPFSGTTPPPPPPTVASRRRPGRIAFAAVALLLTTAALLVVAGAPGRKFQVRESDGIVEVRNALLGRLLWRQDFANEIQCWRVSPWDEDILLVGLAAQRAGGGLLLALDLKSGKTLWEVEPDLTPLAQAFDPQFVYSGAFYCRDILDVDLDGDGRREIVVHFSHNKWFPGVICVVDRDGTVESQYANRGHVYSIHIVDTDSDGKDEIICAGTNNAPAYNGATIFILDDEHRTGAAIDPMTSPGCGTLDSSLVRIVIPIWPEEALRALGTRDRILAFELRTFNRQDGTVGIQASVGYQKDDYYSVDFDAELRPTFMGISDPLLTRFTQAGASQHLWNRAWMNGHLRFEQGILVESSPLP